MPSSRFFASPLESPKFNSVSYLLESRAHDIVQRLTTGRSAQPEEIALEVVLAGASSITNATRQADILGIVNSGFFKTVLGDIGDSFRSEVILYIGKIFEYFWTVSILNFPVISIPFTYSNQWFQDGIQQGAADELPERRFGTRSLCADWQAYRDGISPLRTLPGIRFSTGDTFSDRTTPRMFAGHVPLCSFPTGRVFHRGRALLVECH